MNHIYLSEKSIIVHLQIWLNIRTFFKISGLFNNKFYDETINCISETNDVNIIEEILTATNDCLSKESDYE